MSKVLIKAEGLSKCYQTKSRITTAVDDVTLSVDEGDFVVLSGESGSGKSTLLRLLCLLEQPSKGTLEISGHHVTGLSDSNRARIRHKHIGIVFQQYNLITNINCLDNITLPLRLNTFPGLKKDIGLAVKLAEDLGVANRLKDLPSALSGGKQQRIAIARSLIMNPDLIFADEPTGNLDSKYSASVVNILKKLNDEGKTIFLITHEEKLKNIGNKNIIISDGGLLNE